MARAIGLRYRSTKPAPATSYWSTAWTCGLEFQEFSTRQDAAIELGGTIPGTGIVITSNTNEFNSVIAGVDLTVVEPSDKTITVDVTSSNTQMFDVAQDFVDAYNSIRTFLDDTTSFDSEELTTGILFGAQVALRTDSDLGRVVTAQYFGVGQFTTLASVGITVDTRASSPSTRQNSRPPSTKTRVR